eukprot:gene8632-4358_t
MVLALGLAAGPVPVWGWKCPDVAVRVAELPDGDPRAEREAAAGLLGAAGAVLYVALALVALPLGVRGWERRAPRLLHRVAPAAAAATAAA